MSAEPLELDFSPSFESETDNDSVCSNVSSITIPVDKKLYSCKEKKPFRKNYSFFRGTKKANIIQFVTYTINEKLEILNIKTKRLHGWVKGCAVTPCGEIIFDMKLPYEV